MHAVQGTYAKVKYGQNVQTGEVVAIKVMHATGCSPCSALKCCDHFSSVAKNLHHAIAQCVGFAAHADPGQGKAVEGGHDGPDQA